MKFSIRDFFSKCDQICRKLRTWSHLLKKSLMEHFMFCAVQVHNIRIGTKSKFTECDIWSYMQSIILLH